MLRTFVIVCIGYVFDIAPSFRQAFSTIFMPFLQGLVIDFSEIKQLGLVTTDWLIIILGLVVLFGVGLFQETRKKSLRTILGKKIFFEWVFILFGVLCIIVYGIYGPGYNASEFVYMQF